MSTAIAAVERTTSQAALPTKSRFIVGPFFPGKSA